MQWGGRWGIVGGMKVGKVQSRAKVSGAERVVVKVGSRVLVRKDGRPDRRRLEGLVRDLAALRESGREVVLVSSGAIACGMQALGMKRRPEDLASLQMSAAVGQGRLMAMYEEAFGKCRLKAGQILLTHDDLEDRGRHLNARRCFEKLLEKGVVPVVNENDAVSTEEIKFGDNDALASRTAMLLGADLLVLLTTVDGYLEANAAGKARTVGYLAAVGEAELGRAKGKGSELSTGGMASKLTSAWEAAQTGVEVVIANGRKSGILGRILMGAPEGTWIGAVQGGGMNGRRRWVKYFHGAAHGRLAVDAGAAAALKSGGRSLLAVGVTGVEGTFAAGDLVEVAGADGEVLGRGLSEYSHLEVRAILGMKTREIRERYGADLPDEIIHYENWVGEGRGRRKGRERT